MHCGSVRVCVRTCMSWSKHDINVHTHRCFKHFWEIPDAMGHPSWGPQSGPNPRGSGLLRCSWLSSPQPSPAAGVHTSSSICWTISASFQTPRNTSMPLRSFRTCRPWTAPPTPSSTASSAAPSASPAGEGHTCLGQTCHLPLSSNSDVCCPHSRAPRQSIQVILQGQKRPATLTKSGPVSVPHTFYSNCFNQVTHSY